MKLVIVLLFLAIIFSAWQPTWLLAIYGGSIAEVVSRLWLATSVCVTIVLTWIGNKDLVRQERQLKSKLENPPEEWFRRIDLARNINLGLFAGSLLFTFLVVWLPFLPLFVLNLIGGVALVVVVMTFDLQMLKAAEVYLSEVVATQEVPDDTTEAASKRLEINKRWYYELDWPLLAGVVLAFVVGQLVIRPMILANPTVSSNLAVYADGFAAGAIAVQVVMANVAYAMISALAES